MRKFILRAIELRKDGDIFTVQLKIKRVNFVTVGDVQKEELNRYFLLFHGCGYILEYFTSIVSRVSFMLS